jgi:hypothetical protein
MAELAFRKDKLHGQKDFTELMKSLEEIPSPRNPTYSVRLLLCVTHCTR